MAFIWKLLALVAVMFMPLGMSSASASVPAHAAMANMPMEHCPDQNSGHHGKGGLQDCTMACAAALPAVDAPSVEPLPFGPESTAATSVKALHGLHPEIATPPPKHS